MMQKNCHKVELFYHDVQRNILDFPMIHFNSENSTATRAAVLLQKTKLLCIFHFVEFSNFIKLFVSLWFALLGSSNNVSFCSLHQTF